MVIKWLKKSGEVLINVGKTSGKELRKKYEDEVKLRKKINETRKMAREDFLLKEARQKEYQMHKQRMKMYQKPKENYSKIVSDNIFGKPIKQNTKYKII